MPRYSLRTLLIVMLLGGPLLAGVWFIVVDEASSLVDGWPEFAFFASLTLGLGLTAGMQWLRAGRQLFAKRTDRTDSPGVANVWLTPLFLTVGGLAAAVGTLYFAEHLPVGHRTFRHCVQCRVLVIDHSYFGWEWRTSRECEQTLWHRAHAAPGHQHVWIGSSTPQSWQNWRGKTIGCASKLENGVATLLSPAEQAIVYQRIGDVAAADAWFEQLRQLLNRDERQATDVMHMLKSWAADAESTVSWVEWKSATEAELLTYRSALD